MFVSCNVHLATALDLCVNPMKKIKTIFLSDWEESSQSPCTSEGETFNSYL